MSRKDPLAVSYDDTVTEAKRQLDWMEKNYPSFVSRGILNWWVARNRIAIQTQIVAMLKKQKRDPQLNLNAIFDTLPAPKVIEIAPKEVIEELDQDPDLYMTFPD